MSVRIARSIGVIAMLLLGLAFISPGGTPADAAPGDDCGFGTGGEYDTAICWFDMSAYDDAAATSAAGQTMTWDVGQYTVSAVVSAEAFGGPIRAVTPVAGGSANQTLGEPGYYEGIPGQPILYTDPGPAGTGQTTWLRNITVTRNGSPVQGYELVTAVTEVTTFGQVGTESNYLYSSRPMRALDNRPPKTNGTGCGVNQPDPTAPDFVDCRGVQPGIQGITGLIMGSTNPTFLGASTFLPEAGMREGFAFGLVTSRLQLDKQVDGRANAADSFDVSISNRAGDVFAAGTTGATDTATTGEDLVLPGATYTLTDAATPGTPTATSNYDASWSCANSGPSNTTVLPSGSARVQRVTPAPGAIIHCTVTNSAKASALSLAKSVDLTELVVGEVATYDFALTNDGDLPLSGVGVSEDAFTGSGSMSSVSCPGTDLAVDATMTCTATYTVTQADVDAGEISNTATAHGTTPGAAEPIDSNASTAVISSGSDPSITLTKVADDVTVAVGDSVTYTLTATNDGPVALDDVTITEGAFDGAGTLSALDCPDGQGVTLEPGDSASCTATYTVVAADGPGTIVNEAEATGSTANAEVGAIASETVTVESTTNPSSTTTSKPNPTKPTKPLKPTKPTKAGPGNGALARTGSNTAPLVLVGVTLIGSGAAVLGRRRWMRAA